MSGTHVIAGWESARDYMPTDDDRRRRRYDMREVGDM
jgi:hypothetical protein